jgi:hypothetical protein
MKPLFILLFLTGVTHTLSAQFCFDSIAAFVLRLGKLELEAYHYRTGNTSFFLVADIEKIELGSRGDVVIIRFPCASLWGYRKGTKNIVPLFYVDMCLKFDKNKE